MTTAIWAVALMAASGRAISCRPEFRVFEGTKKEGNVIFDLSPLRMDPNVGGYTFQDVGDPKVRDYMYKINVCGLTRHPNGNCTEEFSVAYQYEPGGCLSLGRDFTDQYASFELLDPRLPTRGVALKYTGGDSKYCKGKKNRTMTIRFVCENREHKMDPIRSAVSELDCDYFITVKTPHACPIDCDRKSSKVCGEKGFCAYDTDKLAPACFCDSGWHGEGCMLTGEDGDKTSMDNSNACDGVCIALIFVFLLLIGLLVAGVFVLVTLKQ
ncbi:hypothetical protein AAMO2058_001314600 [Amorphochlora amoebiformis]